MSMKNIASLFARIFLLSLSINSVSAQPAWRTDLLKYINTKLLKADGGYGWEDQPDSHTTVAFAVTGILFDINALPKKKQQLAEFIRTHHPQKGPNKEAGPSGSELRDLTYQQIQSVLWLGGDVSSFDNEVKAWKSQAGRLANYESHEYGGLYQETMTPVCRKLLAIADQDNEIFLNYLDNCRRTNGSFNNAPTVAGGDGNILNTYWSLYALNSLSAKSKLVPETIIWLQQCQLSNGGFTHQPKPEIGINDDVIYTWAAIKSLKLLGAEPKNTKSVINYLTSLLNGDGGFGDRPGLHSTPVASYYAIDALKSLNALNALDKIKKPKIKLETKTDFTGYKTFTVQFQGSGNGSPQEAVMLADSLKINLWGAKYAQKGWVEEAQKIADKKKVPVTFFIANEPHNNLVIVPGIGSFNHVLDYFAQGKDNVPFADSSTFGELKNTTLKYLKENNGGLMLQVSNNEPLARILLDESINTCLGYKAISTIHFGQNFAFWLPYLMEYRYRLPMVTLQDAHGIESWWWADELTNHRNVFIAKQPTYEAMVTALKNNWITGVRHDDVSDYKTRMMGGTSDAIKFISSKEADWKWWSTPDKLIRPQVAITVINKDEAFEAGKPETGVNIRVRCRWNSVRNTLKTPAATLQQLKVDGKVVTVEEVIKKDKKDMPVDAYYLYQWGKPAKGSHKIEATIKDVSSKSLKTYTQTFVQN